MKQITLQFYEEKRPSFAVSMTLDERWLKKPAQKLVKHFFGAYADAVALKAPNSKLYGIVDIATGADISETVLSTYDFADGAVFSIVRLTNASTNKGARRVNCIPVEVNTVRYPRSENDEDFNHIYDAHTLFLFESRYRNVSKLKYMHSRKRLQERLRRRNAESETDGDTDSIARPPTVTESDCTSSCFEDYDEDQITKQINVPSSRAQAPKDWQHINFKKSMCPHVVAGRVCQLGVDCTYAHSAIELRDRPAPNSSMHSTADIELPKPELWQLGVFAEEARRQPFLWSRMTKRQASGRK